MVPSHQQDIFTPRTTPLWMFLVLHTILFKIPVSKILKSHFPEFWTLKSWDQEISHCTSTMSSSNQWIEQEYRSLYYDSRWVCVVLLSGFRAHLTSFKTISSLQCCKIFILSLKSLFFLYHVLQTLWLH